VSPSTEWLDASASDGQFNETSENWEYTVDPSTGCWNEEGTHTIVCRAEDKVPNGELTPYYSIDIVIDRTPPESTITTPSQYLVNNLSEIIGDANDPAPLEGEWQGIRLQILNKDTTWYWQGGIWDTPVLTGQADMNIKSPVKPETRPAI